MALVFEYYTGFFSKISTYRIMDVLPKLSSCFILDVDRLGLELLYIDTFKDILLVKSAAPSSYDTCCDISCLT